jgi:hypothetical protein
MDYFYEVMSYIVLALVCALGIFCVVVAYMEAQYGDYLWQMYDTEKQKDRYMRWKEQKEVKTAEKHRREEYRALKRAYKKAKKIKMMRSFLDKNKK